METKEIDRINYYSDAVKEAFKFCSEYRKWSLLVDQATLYRVDMKKRELFVHKLKKTYKSYGLEFENIFSDIVWFYDLDNDDIDEKLSELSDKLKELKWNNNPFKFMYGVNSEGELFTI